MYDKFEILNEIRDWEKEIVRLEHSEADESEQILEIKSKIEQLKVALVDAE